MAIVTLVSEETAPSPGDYAGRARALIPLLKDRAKATEAAGAVLPETVQALKDAGLTTLLHPRRFGGYALGPSALVRLGYELGQGCGSTSWFAMVANGNALSVAFWPLQAQKDVWESSPQALVAASGMPSGKGEVTEGGFNIWGRWPFASGCDHTDWFFVASMVSGAGGPPSPAWFLVPKSDVSIDQNSWNVSGLQGTGSKTLFADQPIFVPEHRAIWVRDVTAGTPPGTAIPDNPTARYPFFTFGGAPLVAPLLGMAQGAVDAFVEVMKSKVRAVGPAAGQGAGHNPFIQERVGRAATAVRAGLRLVLTELEAAEAKIGAGGDLTLTERINIRAALGFGARQAVEAVNILSEAAGANAADLNNPIQRFWRDVNAGARHISFDVQAINSMLGQHMFGLDLNSPS